jgi:hypothetical protein
LDSGREGTGVEGVATVNGWSVVEVVVRAVKVEVVEVEVKVVEVGVV